MEVNIADHKFTIIWDGVYYFALSDYPNISKWELAKLLAFMEYERKWGRQTKIVCQNADILDAINHAVANPETVKDVPVPCKITECTACFHNGCYTQFVCHTAPFEAVKNILTSGKLLSASKAFGKPAKDLVAEVRNAAGDPADFFEYVMLSWGNCWAGDRLIMERKLGMIPTEEQLQNSFSPGVRFYFRYSDIKNHPEYVFDGYHPAKVKDELEISNRHSIIIPQEYKGELEKWVHPSMAQHVYYLSYKGLGIFDWNRQVYEFVNTIA